MNNDLTYKLDEELSDELECATQTIEVNRDLIRDYVKDIREIESSIEHVDSNFKSVNKDVFESSLIGCLAFTAFIFFAYVILSHPISMGFFPFNLLFIWLFFNIVGIYFQTLKNHFARIIDVMSLSDNELKAFVVKEQREKIDNLKERISELWTEISDNKKIVREIKELI